ncbi:MAG: DUF4190 domain-containing protein [Bacteroidales bacterium]|nr:DUF4190 domain-containing protein [Bacteroidales bacterium]
MNIKILPFALLALITSLLIASCSTTSRFQPESFAQNNKFKRKTTSTSEYPAGIIEKNKIDLEKEQQCANNPIGESYQNSVNTKTDSDSIQQEKNSDIINSDSAIVTNETHLKKSFKKKEKEKNPTQDPQTPPKKNSSALLGFWLSIAGLISVILPFVGFLAPILYILGLIFSIRGLTQINRSKEYQEGKSLAIAGIIISSIMLLLAILAIAFIILIMMEMLVI